MQKALIFLLVGMVAFAGCADKPAAAEAEDDPFDSLDVGTVSKDKGVIRGVVVDTAIVAVPDATVKIASLTLSTTSNDVGAFIFKDLEPGTYFVEVSKVGYSKAQQSVEVVAGVAAPPIAKVQIEKIPGLEPYAVPSSHNGFISCGLQIANRLIGGEQCSPVAPIFGANDDVHHFPTEARSATFLQTEVTWKPNQPGGDRMTLTTYACDAEGDCSSGADDGQRMCQVWGPSPRVCKVGTDFGTGNPDGTGGGDGLNQTGFGTGTSPGFNTWLGADCADGLCVPGTALGVGVIVDQSFQVYNHVFYNFTPDEDWLFVTDGSPPVPGG